MKDMQLPGPEKNAHRDIFRKLRKSSKWPAVFLAEIPIWNPKKDKEGNVRINILLPHELMHCLFTWNRSPDSWSKLLDQSSLRPELRVTLQQALDPLQATEGTAAHEKHSPSFEEGRLLGFGLWADGVPIKFDRSESLEMISMSIPGISDRASIRLPITCMNKKFFLKSGKTWHALFKIISWSFQCMLQGTFPSHFWDGSLLPPQRNKHAGKSLLGHGVLLEIRGDWATSLPSICLGGRINEIVVSFAKRLLTTCSLHPGAAWRNDYWEHDALLTDMVEIWGNYSPIFESPFCTIKTFCIDWLHTADLGVAQDFLANAMFLMCSKMDGQNHDVRVQQIFADTTDCYAANKVENRLSALTALMIRKAATKSPKLRSKAGEARDLVDWASAAADKYLQGFGSSSEEEACRLAAKHFQSCYHCLSTARFESGTLRFHAVQFLKLYVALEAAVGEESCRWRFKPKFHLWLHVCEQAQSSPALWWTYRDESFGGTIAQISRSKGGAEGAHPMPLNVLTKFCAQHMVPQL